jgi:hypothetical protein
MTTWHSNESIEEAAWFATHSAIPDERYSAAFASVVLATVGSTQWFAQLTGYLAAGAPMLDEA